MRFHKLSTIFPLISEPELEALAQDIKLNGQREPIVLYEDQVLDGRNRWKACQIAKVEPKTTEYKGNSPVAFVVSLNLRRRHLDTGQRACVAVDIEPLLAKEAEARMKAGKKIDISDPVVKLPEGRARDRAGELMSVSGSYVSRAKKLKEESPDEFEMVKAGLKKLSDSIRDQKRQQHKTQLTKLASQEPDTPTGRFDVIVIDPPWPIQKIERECRPNQTEHLDYPTMQLSEIRQSIVEIIGKHANKDCHVFIWTTQRFLPDVFSYFEPGMFDYSSTFVWHKAGGFQPVGLPQFNCEFCLYGRIGSPMFLDTKSFKLCNEWPRGKHSEKPEQFYELLRRVTAGRRLDAFNRRKIDGFIGWGKEAIK